ncbi:MAG: peptidylprolyl isomerase, partial [Clostridia bacterium]|nr:peptidylprolyl isomerase [Clostridia bacterium]
AQMTEKQLNEQKEAKKLRLYTGIFVAVIAVMVCVALTVAVTSTGIIERSTTAVTVGESKVNAVELNYYYIDSINSYVEQWGDYIALSGIDTTKALNEQYMDEEAGKTWSDYFVDQASANIHAVYALYNKAVAEGYTLSEEDAAAIDSAVANLELYGTLYYGYSDLDSFLTGMYGRGADEASYRAYAEHQYIATAYANDHYESLTYSDEDIAAVLAEEPKAYNSYDYNYYYLPASSFLEGGTIGEDDKVTYSDEEKAAAVEAAKAAADSLVSEEITSTVLFDKAIGQLEVNAQSTTAASTAVEGRLYTELSAIMQSWIADEARAEGDMTVIPYESESTDEEGNTTATTNGYYVLYFIGSNDNTYKMNNVRHILVAFTGGTQNEDGTVTYTDEEKAEAKAKADEILATYLAGEQTEDAFAALVHDNTDDTGSKETGGLYENIIPSSNYVENFLNWAIDDARTPGETGIVETEYGYHIMYFVGDSEQSYRDYMITAQLRSEDMAAWETELTESVELTVKNTGKVKADLVLNMG